MSRRMLEQFTGRWHSDTRRKKKETFCSKSNTEKWLIPLDLSMLCFGIDRKSFVDLEIDNKFTAERIFYANQVASAGAGCFDDGTRANIPSSRKSHFLKLVLTSGFPLRMSLPICNWIKSNSIYLKKKFLSSMPFASIRFEKQKTNKRWTSERNQFNRFWL